MVVRCHWGHLDCTGHAIKPLLHDMPDADTPKAGRCWCGEIDYLWLVPLDNRWYCRRCLKGVMRRATWPNAIRFPDEVG